MKSCAADGLGTVRMELELHDIVSDVQNQDYLGIMVVER